MPDLSPPFPLPRRGDRVLVKVYGLDPGPAGTHEHWCRVVDGDAGPDVLFPVTVRLPDGRRGSYQQHELLGWRPSNLRLAWRRVLARA
jgi:hypothetical protein